jgi:hypothetical protein
MVVTVCRFAGLRVVIVFVAAEYVWDAVRPLRVTVSV